MMEDKLLKLLYDDQIITPDQYQQLVQECETSSARPETVLEQFGILKEDEVVEFLSKKFRMSIIDWDEYTVDQELLQMVPEDMAIKYTVFPYFFERGKRGGGGKITLAVADPSDVLAIDDISFRTGCIVKTAISSARAIHQAIQRYYGDHETLLPKISEIDQQERIRRTETFLATRIEEFDLLLPRLLRPGELPEEETDVLSDLDQEHPSTKFLFDLLDTAVQGGISEIHIEPYGQEQQVLFRLHGFLQQYTIISEQVGRGIVARLHRIIPRVDTPPLPKAENMPWIGSFHTSQIKGKFLTVLVSFYPTPYGEKTFLKVVDGSSLMPLEDLGVGEKSLKILNRMLAKPEGLLLLVSPPGMGKTTTLYSIIHQFDSSDMNILTLEHPIEVLMPGINQISVDPQMSYQDLYALISYSGPDLLALENIDSALMAHLAFELASSSLVLASFTAFNLTDGFCTFISLMRSALQQAQYPMIGKQQQEVDSLLFDSINGVVSQRLVRTICSHCKDEVPLSEQDFEFIRWLTAEEEEGIGNFPLYIGKGCQECMGTGYSGQTGMFEVLKFDKQLRQFLLQKHPITSFQLRQSFLDMPVETLKQQGLQKIRDGITTPEEIRRVVFQ
jgi:type IV pilus assembly protein PilB